MVFLKIFLNLIKMKTMLKSLALFAFAITLTNCGEKKETDVMGNTTDALENAEKAAADEAATTEPAESTADLAVANPLIAKGQQIFEGKGTCTTCHKADVKVVGPAIKDIAKIYKDKNASIASFINGEGKPLVDPSQYEIMKANFAITKAMSADDRKALEAYMMSVQ